MELNLTMRKLLLALALALTSSASWAQCTGVFPAKTLCGNLGASAAPPAAFTATGTIGGSSVTTSGDIPVWGNTTGTLITDPTSITTNQQITVTGSLFISGVNSESNTSVSSLAITSTFVYNGLAITFPVTGATAIQSGVNTFTNSNTFSGTTSFTGPFVATSTVSLTTPLSIAFGGTGRTSFPIVPTTQSFTTGSSQNYVTPTTNPSPAYLVVEMCGGGGGGGAQATNNGTPGTSTFFGGWTANPGSGGPNGGSSAAGGAGGTGGVNGQGALILRQAGGGGGASDNAINSAVAGMGGISALGGYGAITAVTTAGKNAQANSCGGGSGGGASAAGGGGGGAGEYVRFQIAITPANTAFIYTVGTSGAGGVPGTVAGGAGADGKIIVREYYQ